MDETANSPLNLLFMENNLAVIRILNFFIMETNTLTLVGKGRGGGKTEQETVGL